MDDSELFDRQLKSLRRFYSSFGPATLEGKLIELDGVQVCVTPRAPSRSVANGVVYRDAAQLGAALEEVAKLYKDAGIKAWTVWVPAQDTEASGLLAQAGHVLDANPEAMGVELEALDGLDDFDDRVTDQIDSQTVGLLNDLAYYSEPGEFEQSMTSTPEGMHTYGALVDAEMLACVAATDHESDCGIWFVATKSSARGQGLATALMKRALRDARERGCTTTTLQATKAGQPIYQRLGYRDLGAMQMWERKVGAHD